MSLVTKLSAVSLPIYEFECLNLQDIRSGRELEDCCNFYKKEKRA